MNNIYDILNDIDTDFSEFEEESLSEIEVKKINERLKGKISSRKGNTTKKAVVWMGRAAVIMLGCLTIGGGVYAAALYRKNDKNDLRIKASESKVISEEGNKVTKEMYDNETGGKATYEVVYDGASTEAAIDNENLVEKIEKAGIANAEIASISKEDSNLKIGVRFNFENDTDLDSLVEKVNAAFTSMTCPKCGHAEKGNRNKKTHNFRCKNCGYRSNDDRVAAMNLYQKGVELLLSDAVAAE